LAEFSLSKSESVRVCIFVILFLLFRKLNRDRGILSSLFLGIAIKRIIGWKLIQMLNVERVLECKVNKELCEEDFLCCFELF